MTRVVGLKQETPAPKCWTEAFRIPADRTKAGASFSYFQNAERSLAMSLKSRLAFGGWITVVLLLPLTPVRIIFASHEEGYDVLIARVRHRRDAYR